MQTPVEKIIIKIKSNKYIAIFIVIGVIIIGLGAVTSALDNILKFKNSVYSVAEEIDKNQPKQTDNTEENKNLKNNIQIQISSLIEEASNDMNEFRLTTPLGNNAYEKYIKILKIDKENIIAKQGISRISAKYVELVNSSISRYSFEKAREYLKRAINIDKANIQLVRLSYYIDDIEKKYHKAKVKKEKVANSNTNKNTVEIPENVNVKNVQPVDRKEIINKMLSSIKRINDDYYALLRVQNGVRKIPNGINGQEMALIISAANIGDDYYCFLAIQTCSKYLVPPVSSNDIDSILSTITDNYYALLAANSLK